MLYDPDGERAPAAAKLHNVPGAETMFGFERFDLVRDVVASFAPFVPDYVPGAATGVLELVTAGGERYPFSATVCFDNAYLGPYVEPLRRGRVDFHFVASNEAWYFESAEMDQMVAMSRAIALATGRSVVRATTRGSACPRPRRGRAGPHRAGRGRPLGPRHPGERGPGTGRPGGGGDALRALAKRLARRFRASWWPSEPSWRAVRASCRQPPSNPESAAGRGGQETDPRAPPGASP